MWSNDDELVFGGLTPGQVARLFFARKLGVGADWNNWYGGYCCGYYSAVHAIVKRLAEQGKFGSVNEIVYAIANDDETR